ncbi:hypothetical protein [Leeuwenhoekiella sp. H156]|uniref:hypothetical protein n=1 Tax=Leeuwenhoekiella sp. H156 TaxID=3450128 RepID=UPI003FA47EF1
MTSKKPIRYFLSILIILIIGLLSNYTVINTDVSDFPIFSLISLFTYFGVLIGFSITIYTFGLSMCNDIKKNIQEIESLSQSTKEILFKKLIRGFKEIKQDIWLIFFAIIMIVIVAILSEIENPFGWEIEKFRLPETVNLSLFIISTIAMFDIMKTLFNLSEINLELLKIKKNHE